MQIATSHFGQVMIEMDDVVHFPRGIVAFEDCRHWVLLSDAENPSLAWLQSVSRAEVALPEGWRAQIERSLLTFVPPAAGARAPRGGSRRAGRADARLNVRYGRA